MKYTILTALTAVASMGLATAATTITATNNSNAATMQIVDNAGNALAGGIVQVGFFADPGNIAVGDFTSFGSATFSVHALAPGVFGSFGGTGITGDLSNASQADDAFIGNSIFVVVFDPGDAGRMIAWDSGQTFASETDLDVGAAVSIFTSTLALVAGHGEISPAANSGLGGPMAGANGGNAVTFTIPEPSSALLFGVAGLALMIRRKR